MSWRVIPAIGVVLFLIASNLAAGVAVLWAGDRWSGAPWYPLLALLALLASYGASVGLVAVLARGSGSTFARAVELDGRPVGTWIAAALLAVIGARLAGVGALALLDAAGVTLPLPKTDILTVFGDGPVAAATAVTVALVLAPVAEEVAFRGVLFPALSHRFGPVAGALVSSAAFAVFHVQPTVMVVVFFAGLAFAWLARRYRSLWPPVLAHVAFNALSLVALFAGDLRGPA